MPPAAFPSAFASLTPAGLTQVSGELATGSQQATFDAMNMFLSLMTDPFVAGRNGGFGGNAGAMPFAEESALRLCREEAERRARCLCQIPDQGGCRAQRSVRSALERLGRGLGGGSNTDGNAALGSNNATARAFGFAAGADYRLSPRHAGRLCARRRRHQFQRQRFRLRALGPVPGRRLRAPQRRRGLRHRRRWPMAGRT